MGLGLYRVLLGWALVVCMYACMHVMIVCMYVCMHACMVFVCVCGCMRMRGMHVNVSMDCWINFAGSLLNIPQTRKAESLFSRSGLPSRKMPSFQRVECHGTENTESEFA